MQAIQFQATPKNGIIRIPDKYKQKIGVNVMVTITALDKDYTDLDDLFPPVIDTKIWPFNREDANER